MGWGMTAWETSSCLDNVLFPMSTLYWHHSLAMHSLHDRVNLHLMLPQTFLHENFALPDQYSIRLSCGDIWRVGPFVSSSALRLVHYFNYWAVCALQVRIQDQGILYRCMEEVQKVPLKINQDLFTRLVSICSVQLVNILISLSLSCESLVKI